MRVRQKISTQPKKLYRRRPSLAPNANVPGSRNSRGRSLGVLRVWSEQSNECPPRQLPTIAVWSHGSHLLMPVSALRQGMPEIVRLRTRSRFERTLVSDALMVWLLLNFRTANFASATVRTRIGHGTQVTFRHQFMQEAAILIVRYTARRERFPSTSGSAESSTATTSRAVSLMRGGPILLPARLVCDRSGITPPLGSPALCA